MKRSLLKRLDTLETKLSVRQLGVISYGWLNTLRNCVGERHIVMVSREPTRSPRFEWCEWEEREGPAPSAPVVDCKETGRRL
jgi:hypothetical protein